jgi:hypothetical protein
MLPKEIVVDPINCPGGTEVGVLVPAIRRGIIVKAHVVQLTGALEGFSYCLYNTVAACPPGTSPTASATAPEKLYRVIPLLVVPTGQDSYMGASGFPRDGVYNLNAAYGILDDNNGQPLAGSPSNQGAKLPLKIIALGAGAKTFGIALTITDVML